MHNSVKAEGKVTTVPIKQRLEEPSIVPDMLYMIQKW